MLFKLKVSLSLNSANTKAITVTLKDERPDYRETVYDGSNLVYTNFFGEIKDQAAKKKCRGKIYKDFYRINIFGKDTLVMYGLSSVMTVQVAGQVVTFTKGAIVYYTLKLYRFQTSQKLSEFFSVWKNLSTNVTWYRFTKHIVSPKSFLTLILTKQLYQWMLLQKLLRLLRTKNANIVSGCIKFNNSMCYYFFVLFFFFLIKS